MEFAGDKIKKREHQGPNEEDKCYNCNRPGHWASECRKPAVRPPPRERRPYNRSPSRSPSPVRRPRERSPIVRHEERRDSFKHPSRSPSPQRENPVT